MAKIIQCTTGANAVNANTTTYYFHGGGDMTSSAQTTEAEQQVTYRTAGTLKNLYTRLNSPNGITATSTFRSRVGAANGGLTISIGSGATGEFEDTSGSDAISAGSIVDYQFVAGATGTTNDMRYMSTTFEATGGTVKKHTSSSGTTAYSTNNLTRYIPISGEWGTTLSTIETDVQWKSEAVGTLQNFYFNHNAANPRTTTTTFGTRIATANGTLLISVGAGLNGKFEDTSHTDAVVVGNKINFYVTYGASAETLDPSGIAVEFSSPNSQFYLIACNKSKASTAISVTTFNQLEGIVSDNTTESTKQGKVRIALTASMLAINVTANTISATSSLTLRQNATSTVLVASITASTIGIFEDTSHSVSIAASDEMNYQLATGGTGTSLTTTMVGVLCSIFPPGKIVNTNQAINRSNTY